jgi:thymidylate kinase
MRIIVIEGCDGTGTSTHAEKLGYALARELGGDRVRIYRHPPHRAGAGDWERSLHYARERAEMVAREEEGRVIVCDRWVSSTDAIALTLSGQVQQRLLKLTALERSFLPLPILTVLLDAPDTVLDERLSARGEAIPPWAGALRRVYREEIARVCDAVLSTAGDIDRVTDRLLSLAKVELED